MNEMKTIKMSGKIEEIHRIFFFFNMYKIFKISAETFVKTVFTA